MIIKGIAIFYLNLRILRIEQADSRLRRACPPPDTGRGVGPARYEFRKAGRSRLWEGPE